MNCLLLFHFILINTSIALLILGFSTPEWLIHVDEHTNEVISEYSKGILVVCRRFYQKHDVRQYSKMSELINNYRYINNNYYTCYNRLYKWYNSSINDLELRPYHKVLIGTSYSGILMAIISLFLTQLINTERSNFKIKFSKRIVNYLLINNIITCILAVTTLMLFFGFEQLQNVVNYGYSFWSYVIGTCCIFLCCIVMGVFRIDVDFEFHPQ